MFLLERIQMQLNKVDAWIKKNIYKSLGIAMFAGGVIIAAIQ